ncbi:YkgJ family cysteine cluster protein [Prochlorococcus sp. MIT 1341]|uniref:YkgJ family cysteine cluster protein n=1 Tax=Prochlorococcus sp. MIT 1341 TaxID=3096221 RepID=UPI002A74F14E|nr:YkgJ family cysteine cluster protein [Prochlorococcus sp. MIT 1341]
MKRYEKWQCINLCGSCCRLAPEERLEALEALDLDQQAVYLSMVKPDGWCKYFDSGRRRCRIYENRPDFCRVEKIQVIFKISNQEANEFAINCCRSQIRSIYGGKSSELRRFNRSIRSREKH